MTRCCHGDTYVVPDGPPRNTEQGLRSPNGLSPNPEPESWAVLCADCDKCLAVVDGPRDEVYADL